MQTNDIIKVKYYRMVGGKPDPGGSDVFLGECEVRPDQTDEHNISLEFSPGSYSIYAVSEDRTGNISRVGNVVNFVVQ